MLPTYVVRCRIALIATVLALGCGGSEPPTKPPVVIVPGRISVTLKREGNGRDADGVSVTVDGQQRVLQEGAAVVFDSMTDGAHLVRFGGLPPHCVGSADSVSTPVVHDATSDVSLSIHCVGGLLSHEISSAGTYVLNYLGEDGRIVPLTTAAATHFFDDFTRDGSRVLFSDIGFVNGVPSSHLFSVRVDGSEMRQLTTGDVADGRPQWSPDGTRIVFRRLRIVDSGYQPLGIMMMNADGSNLHAVTDSLSVDVDPVWSRDGSKIYFGCTRFRAFPDVCVIAPDGSGLGRLSLPSLSAVDDSCVGVCLAAGPQHFVISPDGKGLLIETLVTPGRGPQGIWTAPLDGGDATYVTAGVMAYDARWGPGSDRVLFGIATLASEFAEGTVNKTGTGFRQLTRFDDGINESGDWSPDGATIAYDRFSATQQVMVMNPDGTGARPVTGGPLMHFLPRWSPLAHPGVPSFAVSRSASVGTVAPSAKARMAPAGAYPVDAESRTFPVRGDSKCVVVIRGLDTRVACRR